MKPLNLSYMIDNHSKPKYKFSGYDLMASKRQPSALNAMGSCGCGLVEKLPGAGSQV